MHKEESRTDLGVIKIHENVIVSVATIAAGEIEGVKRIGRNLKSSLWELLGKKDISAIRVEFDKKGEIRVIIPLIIKYGFNIPDIANKVQENVQHALDKMTNLSIKDINIKVQRVERG